MEQLLCNIAWFQTLDDCIPNPNPALRITMPSSRRHPQRLQSPSIACAVELLADQMQEEIDIQLHGFLEQVHVLIVIELRA
jgi:hypothetical protein